MDQTETPNPATETRWRKLAPAGLLTLTAASALGLALRAVAHSEFLCDDMDALSRLRAQGLLRGLWDPVNIQVVPLHRLAMWVIDALFGVDHRAAVIALLGLHGLGLWLLHRLLSRLMAVSAHRGRAAPPHAAGDGHRLLVAALVLVYAAYPLLQVQFLWYSAGLHRLPYAAASFWTLERWLAYRQTGARRHLAFIGLGIAIASGFYGKGPILAPQLCALELALWHWTTRDQRPRHARALGVLLLGAVGLAVLNVAFASHRPVHAPDLLPLLTTLPKTAALFVGALGGELRALGPLARPSGLSLAVGSQLILVALAFSLASGRRYRPVWGVMALGFIGHVAVVALSNRSADGLLVFNLLAHRYYIEPLVLLVPLAGLALSGVRVPRAIAAPATAGILVVVGGLAAHHMVTLSQVLARGPLYGQFRRAHAFYETLDRELRRVSPLPPDARVVMDEPLPPSIACYAPYYMRVSSLAAMRELPMVTGPGGALLLEDDGRLAPKGADYDPQRHDKLRARRRMALERMMKNAARRRGAAAPGPEPNGPGRPSEPALAPGTLH